MTDVPDLEAYRFFEREWESYDQLCESFEWEVPSEFNTADYVCDRWASDDGRIAIHAADQDGNERAYTFSELRTHTDELANYLVEQGVAAGDRVGVNVSQRPETAMAHIACWKIGAVSVPLSTLFGPDALGYRLGDAGVVACIVDETTIETLRAVATDLDGLGTVLVVGGAADARNGEVDFWTVLDNSPAVFENVRTGPEDDAVILYSSGTTGPPMGVRHAHRLLLGHLPTFITAFCNMSIDESDVVWTPSDWAWIASLYDVVFPTLYYGASVVAYDGGPFEPPVAYELIERYGVSIFFAPPTGLRMMMNQADTVAGRDVSSVRVVPSGGESLGKSIVDWANDTFEGAAVHEAYGQTEANLLVGDCTALMESRESKIGRAGPGHTVRIVDPDTGEPTVEPGDVGEIAVRYEGDPVCFKEYWNEPEKTAAKVRDGWLLTEDLGVVDEDGYFSFVSRKDDVIISAGYRIGPEEIEETLASHEAVADVGVVGVPDKERGEVPKAFVVTAPGIDADDTLKTTLREFVRERLAKYEYPREVEFIDELPTTTTGKIRRSALKDSHEDA